MSAKQPIAIFHYRFVFPGGRTAWCNYQCFSSGEVTGAIHCARRHEERFYIEWLDTNHGDGRDD